MKAVVIEKLGPPEVLKIVTDWPKPQRKKPGDVLIRIEATSVNPLDFKTRSGVVPRFLVRLPKVLGGDLAGTVVESDEGSAFKVGMHVYACTSGFFFGSKEGCYAEYFVAQESHMAVAPRNISLAHAAGLPLVSVTAWQALDMANLSPGARLLIHGGAGGVGSMAIQLAKARGLHVTTTCSARNMELVKSLGADDAIDYTTQRFELVCEPFDGVIDLIGGEIEVRSMQVLKRSGVFVCVLNNGWSKNRGPVMAAFNTFWYVTKWKTRSALRLGPRYKLLFASPSGDELREVAQLVESGKVRPVIDRVLPLEKAAEAHAYIEQGHARGKVILTVSDTVQSEEVQPA